MIIRRTNPGDAIAMARLAAIDSKRPIEGDALVAEVDGRLLAAVSLTGDHSIADPFTPTADLVAMLEMRAAQLAEPVRARRSNLPAHGRRPRLHLLFDSQR